MNFDEALKWAIDNKINCQFRKVNGEVILVAVNNDKWTVITDVSGWTFRRVFNSLILPALNRLKNQEP